MAIRSSVLRKDTRYVQGGTTTVSKKKVGWWERSPTFTERAPDDIVIQSLPVVYDGAPGLLAYDIYQSNNLEWVVLQYNNIVDVNEEFVAGARIVLPSPERLFSSMLIKTVTHEESDV
jgi:hypothetical protein